MHDVVEVGNRYYILAGAATALQQTLVLKHEATFGLFGPTGDIDASFGSPQGLYHEGTRFLSHLETWINGRHPLLLSSDISADSTRITVDLTNPDILAEDESGGDDGGAPSVVLARGALHVARSRYLWEGGAFDRLTVTNYSLRPVDVAIALQFDADFADIFEIRGTPRARRGERLDPVVSPDTATLGYRGLDGIVRRTTVRAFPTPQHVDHTSVRLAAALGPRQRTVFHVSIRCDPPAAPHPPSFGRGASGLAESVDRFRAGSARIASSNEHVAAWTRRSLDDVRMLLTRTADAGPGEGYPYAGIPWFSTPFGRDGIITALQLLWVNPGVARGVLRYLAANQARTTDPASDAEPGKILHERRVDEMANTGEVPFGRYYGSIDSTPLFVTLAGRYYAATGDRALIESIWPNIELALQWIDRYGDADGDGFVEYQAKGERGLVNQGWKDSGDAVSHADGSLAQPPIAICEVQAYVYQAKRSAAALALAMRRPETAAALESQAEHLRRRFNEVFWLDDLRTYALALDADKRPCAVRASNAGHCLFGGIADPGRARLLARTLMSRAMFSGWGIRTLAAGEARYDPMSYHNGSIWPHDNAIIAAGLARYGFRDAASRVFRAAFDAAVSLPDYRLPELMCGFSRRRGHAPTQYPVACSPQAWAAGASFMMLAAALGLSIDALSGQGHLRLRRPRLPETIDAVRIDNLRIGTRTVNILFVREGDDVSVLLLHKDPGVRITVEK